MAKRPTLEDRLQALHEISHDPNSDAALRLIRKELGSRSSLAVAAAAKIVAEHELIELGDALPAAFERFESDPIGSDPGCNAKSSVIDAMVRLQHPSEDLFLSAISYEQWEPVYGDPPQVETAGPIRGACCFALVQLGHPDAMRKLAVLLADSHPEARVQAIRSAGLSYEHEAAAALLRFKARVGDENPSVLRECLETLLAVDGDRGLPFVAEFLARSEMEAECAALALGSSRLDGAFRVLRSWHQDSALPEQTAVASLAIATLRSDEAFDFLFRLIEQEPKSVATNALKALAIYAHDTAIRDRAEACVASDPSLKAVFHSVFLDS